MTEADLKLWADGKIHGRWTWGEVETAVLALFAERDSLASGCETERASFARQIQAAEAKLAEAEARADSMARLADANASGVTAEYERAAAAEAGEKALRGKIDAMLECDECRPCKQDRRALALAGKEPDMRPCVNCGDPACLHDAAGCHANDSAAGCLKKCNGFRAALAAGRERP